MLLSLVSLFSSPCFEELETLTLSVIASSASKPSLSLPGVKKTGDSLFPERVDFHSSDVSLYYGALTTKPEGMNLLDLALFSSCQKSPMMQKVQQNLLDKGYRTGDLVVDGYMEITLHREPNEMAMILGVDLSSINMTVNVDLVLTQLGKEWKVKGIMEVAGDSKGNLVVQSNEFVINSSKYRVDLKYRLKKGS